MTPTMSRRRVLQGLGVLGLGGAARAAGAQDCVEPPPSPPLPGTIGLLRGQFARLAVVNHDHGNQGGYVDPELIVAEIFGADGKALASAQFSKLGANEARFLDFVNPATDGKPLDSRIELFSRVRYTPGYTVGASLQIVDGGSGLTLFPNDPEIFQDPTLSANNELIPAVYPLPGTIGLVRGQLLRVSMVKHGFNPNYFPIDPEVYPSDPELIVADVLDGKGKLLATGKFSNLSPHQAAFLDFPHPGGDGAQRDTRLEVSVHVRFTPGHRIGATVAVLDPGSGQFGAIIDPDLFEDPALKQQP